jgi:hypothetical protein
MKRNMGVAIFKKTEKRHKQTGEEIDRKRGKRWSRRRKRMTNLTTKQKYGWQVQLENDEEENLTDFNA